MNESLVETSHGTLRGRQSDGVHAYLGLPYGGPTGGSNRFLPPTAAEHWTGARDALEYGAASPQAPAPDQAMYGLPGERFDEDCLRLNVWTPAGPGDPTRRPVMVWFHGGGFTQGSGSWPVYEGAALARRGDVIVVTVNHRLGILGYLHLGELAGEPYASSGNAGMLDLCAALEWVRDNIAAFGGDPEAVTIFGESGGGFKVSLLLTMPRARGLFHRAVIQSGPGLRATEAADATEDARAALAELAIEPGDTGALAALPVEQLIDAQIALARGHAAKPRNRLGFAPVLDGAAIPEHPADAIAAGRVADVPIMIGTNRDEGTLFFIMFDPAFRAGDMEAMGKVVTKLTNRDLDATELRSRLEAALGEHGDRAIDAYRNANPNATPMDLLVAITSDQRMRIPSIQLAERKLAGGGAPVYMYLFTWSDGGFMGAGHALELPFMFDNVGTFMVPESTPDRAQLASRMSDAWIAFARDGDPNHADIPKWSPYSTHERATMLFDTECRVVTDPQSDERRFWDSMPAERLGI